LSHVRAAQNKTVSLPVFTGHSTIVENREPVAAADLDTVIDYLLDTLRTVSTRDWTVPAGTLDWSCWATGEHLGQALAHWASQLTLRATTRYVRWVARAQEGAPPDGVLDLVEASGHLLAVVVRSSPPSARAFHPMGVTDPEGFAGMGCVESLAHGHDLATGLGVAVDPPAAVCDRVVRRMFPHHLDAVAGADPWQALLWSTGRADLPGLDRPTDWRWRGQPLDEPWDPHPTPDPIPFLHLLEAAPARQPDVGQG
jgi:hypothetical protein